MDAVNIGSFAKSVQGIKTGDDGRLRRTFWELDAFHSDWSYYQSTFERSIHFGGLEYIIYWADDGDGVARKQGLKAWGKMGWP